VTLPPLGRACRLTVAIPAKNEERHIVSALAALAHQVDDRGDRLRRGLYDIVVLANNCVDRTAGVARAYARRRGTPPIHVVEARMPRGRRHVGGARRELLDAAAARFLDAGRLDGIVATTDADTIVAPDWVAATIAEMRNADAVAGHVTIGDDELRSLLPGVRKLYEHERAYRAAFAAVETRFDPVAQDPAPRHSSFVGASFAVRASAYVAAGGMPRISPLEDRAFFFALRRIDARVRHSMRVRAQTSARRDARVAGGFGTFMAELEGSARDGRSFLVEHAMQTLAEIRLRGTLRSAWYGAEQREAIERLRAEYGLARSACVEMLDPRQPFGHALERALHAAAIPRYGLQPVEAATATLRLAFEEATPVCAIRMSAASGAG
jgi:glycosyltransferase involved in cell wall biosynthesis